MHPNANNIIIYNLQGIETKSSTNQQIKKMWYIETIEYYKPLNKHEISQTEKDIDTTYIWTKNYNNLVNKANKQKKAADSAALFTIHRAQKQPKCLSTENQIKKMWYINIYNRILLSHKKK